MDKNIYNKYQKILDDIEKKKKKSQVLEDHLKAAQLRHAQQIDYQKNGALRKERTHRLVQKGALFEKYIEDHIMNQNSQHLHPNEAETLLDVISDLVKKNRSYIMNQWKNKNEERS